MLGGDKPRKDLHAATLDDEIVEAATKRLAAAFDDTQAAPRAAINRCELVEMGHAVRDRMNRAVIVFRGQVVEHQHRRLMLREIMLEREDLAAVAQRALRQQARFRKAVDHDTLRLEVADRLQHALGRLSKLKVRGIKEALLLLGIEDVFGWHKLENPALLLERPAMRAHAGAQLLFGLGQADVDAEFAGSGARHQELQRNGGLAGAGIALEQVQAVPGEAATEHEVQAGDASAGAGQSGSVCVHGAAPISSNYVRERRSNDRRGPLRAMKLTDGQSVPDGVGETRNTAVCQGLRPPSGGRKTMPRAAPRARCRLHRSQE